VTNKARILLVDDRGENLVALEAILSSLNQVLVPVRSGEEALKALLVEEFAVILLDVVMPGMDGFETAAHIKRRPKTRDVPIIFLTAASAEPDHAFRGYAAGAVDYISKPFDQEPAAPGAGRAAAEPAGHGRGPGPGGGAAGDPGAGYRPGRR